MEKVIINRKLLKQLDIPLIIAAIGISLFGAVNIFSATHGSGGLHYFKLQLIWILVGLAVIYCILLFDYSYIFSYSTYAYWVSVLVLVYTKFGNEAIKGASSWIKIGGITVEPGEFAKIALVMILAKSLYNLDGEINNLANFAKMSCYALIIVVLIVIEPNLGMALICCFITLGVFFIAGLDLKAIFLGFASLIPIGLVIWYSGILHPYQKDRITSFLNPEVYQQTSGYQLMQSLTGIGSGGVFGQGFLKGSQVSGGYIPEVHTDFIFAVVGSEWGLIGAIFLLIMYSILIYRIIKIAKESKDVLGRLTCVGIAAALLFSIFQNIGMTIGVMPVAGITLPFMSYGGSSILANFISIALVLNVGMRRKKIVF